MSENAIAVTAECETVALSIPADAVADEFTFDGLTHDEIARQCEVVGGQLAVFRELDESEDAKEFAECSARLPSHHIYPGAEELVAAPWREAGERTSVRKPAPVLGEGDGYVLSELLSYSESDITRLNDAGIVGVPELAQPSPPKQKKANV